MTTDWEWQRAEILQWVGPGQFFLVVHKDLRDAVLEQFNFQPEDVPGLIAHKPFVMPPAVTLKSPRLTDRPLPYPPRKRGRYAR